MRTPIVATAILASLALSACVTDEGRGGRPGYGSDRHGRDHGYRGDDRRDGYRGDGDRGDRGDRPRRHLGENDQIYRDNDGRYYCKRDDGTTGTIVGAIAGGVLGNIIAPGGSKTLGTILGGAGGAIAGNAIDRNDVSCE
jgi:hypothetical protein